MNYTHNSNTNYNQLEFYEHRLKNTNLIWCNQILKLIKPSDKNIILKLNDIGCNYFQFYKEVKRLKLEKCFNYFGYDIDSKFIELGLKYYPELKNKSSIQNIEDTQPRNTEISVISATLEHCENPFKLLKNVCKSSSKKVVLRTFLGKENIIKLQDNKKHVKNPYFINQFSFEEIITFFLKHNFSPKIIKDKATKDSKLYEVGVDSNIFRKMFIIIAEKK